jgi:phage-related protein
MGGDVPITSVILYRELDGSVPFLDWFDRLPDRAKDRCRARLELLRAFGHELRRPAAENLGRGVYELRARSGRVNYRMVYFFHGQRAVVVSHGFAKQQAEVPPQEVELARRRMCLFVADPPSHTHQE